MLLQSVAHFSSIPVICATNHYQKSKRTFFIYTETSFPSTMPTTAPFRAARLDLGGFINSKIIRDHTKRKVFEKYEPERYAGRAPSWTQADSSMPYTNIWTCRQALRYLIRNTTLPQRIRAQAQLQLSQMHCYTRSTQIQNRCVMGGVARGVFRAFRMGRVRLRWCIVWTS
jgi:small subunit ribosomal protein S14